MSVYHNPRIVTDGLVLALDAGNPKSYSGSGTTWSDLSGNGNNGILVNGVGYNSGNLGCLTFDGVDDYSDLTTIYSPLSAPWTLSSWTFPIFDGSKQFNNIFYSASNPRTLSFFVLGAVGARGVDVDLSGNIYIASQYISNGRLGTLKFNSSYQLDTNFGDIYPEYLSNSDLSWRIKVSSYYQGKVYVSYREVEGNDRCCLRRLNSDGSLDTSFNPGGSGFNIDTGAYIIVYGITEDSNGKIYVGGFFTSYNGTTANRIIRLNTDGSIDTGFNTGTGFDNNVFFGITEDSNGKIYVGGAFTSYNGTTANRIIRLNPDGSIDTGFNTGTGFSSSVYSITEDSNGKIYVGGFFTSYNGTTANRIIRLNTDGSIDTGFNTGTGFDSAVFSPIIEDANGKIYIIGAFTSYNGTTANRIIRLNPDGSIDTGFNTGTGFDNAVYGAKIDSNGRIIVTGIFTSYNGTSVSGVVALNSDGSLNIDIANGLDTFVNPIQRYFGTSKNTFGGLNLQSSGFSSERYMTSTDFHSTFNGNTPINCVETMSSTGTYRCYLNGVLQFERPTGVPDGVNIEGLMRGTSSSSFFNGKVSNISIYNKELNSSEVQQNFTALRGRFGI